MNSSLPFSIGKVRKYGTKPYKIIVLHGGPGGMGSACGIAQGLFEKSKISVLEPFQSQYTIKFLIQELYLQISTEEGDAPFVLIGHSWGAWLALLFAVKYPNLVGKLILIGTPPFSTEVNVDSVRQARLSPLQQQQWKKQLQFLKEDSDISSTLCKFRNLLKVTDFYHVLPSLYKGYVNSSNFDSSMFQKIWSEAVQLRNSQKWISILQKVKCPIIEIYGDYDPHLSNDLQNILTSTAHVQKEQKNHFASLNIFHLPQCGHVPWVEKYAKKEFFKILFEQCCRDTLFKYSLFPPADCANEYGILGYSDNLDSMMLADAYWNGIFPWPYEEKSVLWCSPPKRGFLPLKKVHFPKRFLRDLKKFQFQFRINTAFDEVIESCAKIPRNSQDGSTWITKKIQRAYKQFHRLGYAHSFEAFNQENQLVGGLYGVSIGQIFCGESMFFKESGASKYVFYKMVECLRQQNVKFLDTQVVTPLTAQFGAKEIPRIRFLRILKKYRGDPLSFSFKDKEDFSV